MNDIARAVIGSDVEGVTVGHPAGFFDAPSARAAASGSRPMCQAVGHLAHRPLQSIARSEVVCTAAPSPSVSAAWAGIGAFVIFRSHS